MEKWLPFFDWIEEFVKIVNSTQYFYGSSTYVGLLRIKAFIINAKPNANATDAVLSTIPDAYKTKLTYTVESPKVVLPLVVKNGTVSCGWLDNATGFAATEIPTGSTGNKSFTALWTLADELFISEYGEGSSNNKWIEIYNPNDFAVNMAGYKVILYSNGATTPSKTLQLTGILAAGEVYVIYNSSAVQAIIDAGDIAHEVTYFNGNDALGLYKGTELLDLIGVIGEAPETNWPAGVAGATSEFTLVRKPDVGANATFTAAEWNEYPQNTFTYVGAHTFAE
jgi:hypothetical protein